MPVIRPGVSEIAPYEAGRPIEEVARSMGVDPAGIIKLASNESPLPPFPEVVEAIARAASGVNRYPDNGWHDLSRALASHLNVAPDQLMFGGGSSELLRVIALALGGPGTSAVYAWPSFVIYRLASIIAGTDRIEVPLKDHVHDPGAMLAAIREDTNVLYFCNPNNPTGTYVAGADLIGLIEAVPERVLVVIDEAYYEYVTAADYATALPEALARPNVVVARTFSKVYGLAALRVGYAIGQAETLRELRRAQAPFTVSSLAQVAATVALQYPDQVEDRVRANAEERERLEKELGGRHIEYVPSQANFVFLRHGASAFEDFLRAGVIVRAMGGEWIRVTVGTPEENDRFLATVDDLSIMKRSTS
ncbi:MAG TPA: histidinol-phosphate transaminase [Acidimicrobiia bacterium]|nr:histidinol-phosphate transaminase [Acidimicrobiia bacterium]